MTSSVRLRWAPTAAAARRAAYERELLGTIRQLRAELEAIRAEQHAMRNTAQKLVCAAERSEIHAVAASEASLQAAASWIRELGQTIRRMRAGGE